MPDINSNSNNHDDDTGDKKVEQKTSAASTTNPEDSNSCHNDHDNEDGMMKLNNHNSNNSPSLSNVNYTGSNTVSRDMDIINAIHGSDDQNNENASVAKSTSTRSSKKSSSKNSYRTSNTPGGNHSSEKGCCGSASLTRTVILRGLLTLSLLAAIATCTAVSYTILRTSEYELGRQTFSSIASSAVRNAQAITSRKLQGSEVMSVVMSHAIPDKEGWPLIHMDGYIPIADKVAKLSSSTTQSLVVMFDPDTVTIDTFEEHTQQVYQEQGRPEEAGVSEFGFGVWKPDPKGDADDENNTCDYKTDCRLHQEGDNQHTWEAARDIVTPLMMHNQPTASSLLYNLYSQDNRGIHIDSMMDCVDRAFAQNATATESPSCAVITDFLELKVKPGPAGLLFQPIYPANDPTTFVAFAVTSIHWEEVLTSVVPDYVDGLTCVVSTASTSYTYEIRQGVPQLIGEGNIHDPTYDEYAQTIVLNPDMGTGALSSAVYTLTVYPTAEMFDAFETKSPVVVSLGFFGVVAFCTLIFVLYDYLMRYEATQRQNILEMKRRFVRFISHEIRTPLNTVCMGLELLESELQGSTAKKDNGVGEKLEEEDVDFWYSVTTDIKENAHTAVEILNDLLNYDKLETGTLSLETGGVSIWSLVERTVNQFQIQAVNRKIDLKLDIVKPNPQAPNGGTDIDMEACSSAPFGSELFLVVGDDLKLGQVMRNLISNALKFTPIDGKIQVTAAFVPGGLPEIEARPLNDEDSLSGSHQRAGSVQIMVQDSGIGLNSDQLQQLFTEGVQFDANRLQHGGGSGLGLAIAKGIVEQHRGTIRAESEGNGRGTTFIIELPLYEFSASEIDLDDDSFKHCSEQTDNTAAETEAPEEAKKVGRRILVAEDTPSSLKMLMRLLERAGHSCAPAENGRQAVDAIKADLLAMQANPDHESFDTVLMDHEMPLIKGPEATKMIRAMGYPGTIIGVTGNVLPEDIEFFKAHGADEVLPKPISLAKISAFWERQERGENTIGSSKRSSVHRK